MPAIPSITTAPCSPVLAPFLAEHSTAHNAATSADSTTAQSATLCYYILAFSQEYSEDISFS